MTPPRKCSALMGQTPLLTHLAVVYPFVTIYHFYLTGATFLCIILHLLQLHTLPQWKLNCQTHPSALSQ